VTATTSLGPSRRPALADLWPLGAAFVAFVLAWQAVVLIGRLPAFILPGPAEVAIRFVRAWTDGTMWPHASTTLSEVVLGFAAGSIVGVVAGYGLARFGILARLASPYLVAAQAVPILAIAPLLSLWFGTGLLPKVIICGLIVFFPVAIATMVGVREVDRGLLELARSLRASRRRVLVDVELPAALPVIFGGLRVGVTLSVVGAIVGEWAGPDTGLGVLVNLARGSLFDTPLLFATLVTIALLGIVAYGLVVLAERRLVGLR
jgi:NitT/TauT family transport system permease protein